MPYVNNNENNNDFASKGMGVAAFVMSLIGAGGVLGLLNGGAGGLFGNGQNPAASNAYQLAQKDTIIAKLEAERYSDQLAGATQIEIGNLKQRIVALETAAPLREKIVGEQVGFVTSTVNRLVQPMIPGSNVYTEPSSTDA